MEKKEAPKKPSRPSTPPHKRDNYDNWFNWYKEEIKERISKGETKDEILKALKIRSIDKFINDGK